MVLKKPTNLFAGRRTQDDCKKCRMMKDSILYETLITRINTVHKFVKIFIKVFLLYVQNFTKNVNLYHK